MDDKKLKSQKSKIKRDKENERGVKKKHKKARKILH